MQMKLSLVILLVGLVGVALSGTLSSCSGGFITTSGTTKWCVTYKPSAYGTVYVYTNMADTTQVLYQVQQGTNPDGTPKYVPCSSDGSPPTTTMPPAPAPAPVAPAPAPVAPAPAPVAPAPAPVAPAPAPVAPAPAPVAPAPAPVAPAPAPVAPAPAPVAPAPAPVV